MNKKEEQDFLKKAIWRVIRISLEPEMYAIGDYNYKILATGDKKPLGEVVQAHNMVILELLEPPINVSNN